MDARSARGRPSQRARAPAPPAAAAGGALPALAGGSPELDEPARPLGHGAQPEVAFVAVLAGAATLFFGIVPEPLFNLVHGAGAALGLL